MKFGDESIPEPLTNDIKIFRGERTLIFRVQAVLSVEPFEKLCPEPKPPLVTEAGGHEYRDFSDKDYEKAVEKHQEHKTIWRIVKSLSATPNLSFEFLDLGDPQTLTFENLYKDFKMLTDGERAKLMNATVDINNPTEDTVFENFIDSDRQEKG